MNELRRLATLETMGVAAYVSRHQLPGAAPTRRLAVVRRPCADIPQLQKIPQAADALQRPVQVAPPPGKPRITVESPVPQAQVPPRQATEPASSLRFSLAAIVAGGWLWLEQLEGPAMTPEQLMLVQAMAGALSAVDPGCQGNVATAGRPEAEYFNWPLHNNQQLDQGVEAARSGVAGFIQRRLEQRTCSGLVLLGEECRSKVPLEQIDCSRVACTVSTARMLVSPAIKKQAWTDLQAALRSA